MTVKKEMAYQQLTELANRLPHPLDDAAVKKVGLENLIIRGQYAQQIADGIVNSITKDRQLEIAYSTEGLAEKQWDDRFVGPEIKATITQLSNDPDKVKELTETLFDMHEFLWKLKNWFLDYGQDHDNKDEDTCYAEFNTLLEHGHDWLIRRLLNSRVLTNGKVKDGPVKANWFDNPADFIQEDGYTFFDKQLTIKLII